MTNPVARRLFATVPGRVLLLALCLFTAGAMEAATFNIGDGDVAGLIAAIQTANTNGQANVINLAPHGAYVLTAPFSPQINTGLGPTGLPYIVSTLTINGNGSIIMRSSDPGTPKFRIIYVFNPSTSGILTLDGVTLAGGEDNASNDIYAHGGGGLGTLGGVVFIKNSTITHNTATYGGGVLNFCGIVIVLNSTISYNTSQSANGGGGVLQYNWACSPGFQHTTTISFSTIFENQAHTNAGFEGRGDAIATAFDEPGTFVVKNSILASPTQGIGDDCYPTALISLTSLGHNIAADASCGLVGPGDLNSTNPLLGPLADNGGPTPTHLPLSGSPAIDAVPLSYCSDPFSAPVTTDQRGVARPQGLACDIGSVDVAGDATPPLITPTISGTSGSGGWYRSPVTVSWSVTDPESGIASSSGCGNTTLLGDTAGVTLTCSATNGTGLSNSVSVTVKIDATPPVLTASRTPAPNGAGWNNSNVTVNFTCTDGLSGVSVQSPLAAVIATEGANQLTGGSCTDQAGNSASVVVSGISIDKTPPTTTNSAANPNPAAVNSAITLSASLSDQGGSNLTVAEYSVNGSAPSTLAAASGAASQISAAIPAFSATGIYNVCVHARDLAGNTGADECFFLPVYDPAGGFVTGGGWINSPLGAYTADASLTGKATFGFESRYQHGANVPTGDTQFQFQTAKFNFKSTSYEWLVIAGARAQYKGVGTVNGAGSYSFLLTAIDGQVAGGGGVDRFRIKIWSDAGMVYDNQSGGSDDADPSTALGGGSIVIHKN